VSGKRLEIGKQPGDPLTHLKAGHITPNSFYDTHWLMPQPQGRVAKDASVIGTIILAQPAMSNAYQQLIITVGQPLILDDEFAWLYKFRIA
jgi:hypothetical protein